MTDPRYPIGKFEFSGDISPAKRAATIAEIAALPAAMRKAVAGLTDQQLDTPYREGGWTVRQVVHHTADSHIHAYCRQKFTADEDTPTIKPYNEVVWAEFADAKSAPIELSLALLDALHTRWVTFLKGLPDAAFERNFRHPETGEHSLGKAMEMYVWHGKHHTAHVTELRKRMGW